MSFRRPADVIANFDAKPRIHHGGGIHSGIMAQLRPGHALE